TSDRAATILATRTRRRTFSALSSYRSCSTTIPSNSGLPTGRRTRRPGRSSRRARSWRPTRSRSLTRPSTRHCATSLPDASGKYLLSMCSTTSTRSIMKAGEPTGRFAEKTALVTGAAGGIGAAIVRQFRSEGARVAVADRVVSGIEAEAHLPGDLLERDYADGLPQEA